MPLADFEHDIKQHEIEQHVTQVYSVHESNVTAYLKYKDQQIKAAAKKKERNASVFDKLIKPFTPGPRLWVADLPEVLNTGDVLLFSAHSSDMGGNIIKFFTNTNWNHVGIVYKPETHRCYMLDWTAGLHVYDLVEVLRQDVYESGAWQEVAVRQLDFGPGVDRKEMEDKMESFIHQLIDTIGRAEYTMRDGTKKKAGLGEGLGNTSFPLAEGVSAFFKQLVAELNVPSCTSRRNQGVAVKDDLKTLFCSKFVAACFKSVGLIAPHRNAADFTPKAFAPEGDAFLDLQHGASLGRPIAISFEPLVARKAVVSLLRMVMDAPVVAVSSLNSARSEEERAARMVQRFARGIRAKKQARIIASVRRQMAAERQAQGGEGELYGDVRAREYRSLTKKINELKQSTYSGEASDPDQFYAELGLVE